MRHTIALVLLVACGDEKPSTSTSTSPEPPADPACLAALGPVLAAMPPETWSAAAPVAPTDRAALEKAVAVSFDPATGKVENAGAWFARRKLGAIGGCAAGAPPADVVAVRTTHCEEVSTGKGYQKEDGTRVAEVMSARCSGALVWVRRSGDVLARVVANATGSPGAMPDTLKAEEVSDFTGRARSDAYFKVEADLLNGVASWSAADRAIFDAIHAEDRAKRLEGSNVSKECLDNPLAKGCM